MNDFEAPRLTTRDNPSYTGVRNTFMSDETGGDNARPTGEEGRPPEPPRPPRNGERRGRGRSSEEDHDEDEERRNEERRREEAAREAAREAVGQREIIRERRERTARELKEAHLAAGRPIPAWIRELEEVYRESNEAGKIELIKRYLQGVNPSSREQYIQTPWLELAADYDETLEYLVNKIVVPPLVAETGEYQLGLYASGTLEELKEILDQKSNEDRSGMARVRYNKALGTIEATRNFHHMNKTIVTGVIKSFVDAAQVVTPEQLQTLNNVPGVAQVLRFFDQELTRHTAKSDYINKKRYDMLTGIKRNPETGEIELIGAESIRGRLEELQKQEIKLTGGRDTNESIWGLKKLEAWQLNWAFLAGRIISNISLRSAENMSLGAPSKGPASGESYYSPPLESAQTIINPLRKYKAFDISEGRAGTKFVKMVSAIFQRDREKWGYGKTRVKKISGKEMVAYEDSGIFEVAGIFAGWRQDALLLSKSPIPEVTIRIPGIVNGVFNGVKEQTASTMLELIDVDQMEKERRDELQEKLGWSEERAGRQARKELPQVLRTAFLDEHGNLRNEINANLGVLIKSYSLVPKLTDSPEMREARREIREKIWQRVAQDNPLAIIPFLIETELYEKDVSPEDLRKFRRLGWVSDDLGVLRNERLTNILRGEKDGPDTALFGSLYRKLIIAHERRLAAIRNRQTGNDINLDNILEKNGERVRDLHLTPRERDLLIEIRENGKLLAPDFATIRQPFNPFMNDVLFEKADYSEPGAEFFRRRMGADVAQLAEASQAILDIMNNPGGLEWKEIVDNLYKMVQAIGIVHSVTKGQDRVAPVVEALLTMGTRGSQIEGYGPFNGVVRWLAKSEVYNLILNKTDNANSLLQQVSGTNATADDEFGLGQKLDQLLHKGVTRRAFYKYGVLYAGDQYWEFKKKLKATLLDYIAAFIRDVLFPATIGAAAVEVGKATARGK